MWKSKLETLPPFMVRKQWSLDFDDKALAPGTVLFRWMPVRPAISLSMAADGVFRKCGKHVSDRNASRALANIHLMTLKWSHNVNSHTHRL